MNIWSRLDRTAHAHDERIRTNPGEFGQKRTNPNPGKFGRNQGETGQKTGEFGQKMGKNGQKTGERNRILAKQGETESFAKTLFGFGHPCSIPASARPMAKGATMFLSDMVTAL